VRKFLLLQKISFGYKTMTISTGYTSVLTRVQLNIINVSLGKPTYWPTDLNKIPDLLDLAITKGISDIYSSIKSNLDMSSDLSPIVITLSNHVIWKKLPIRVYIKDTNWTQFQDHINDNMNLNLQLKVNQDIQDAVDYITQLIQTAAWTSTPNREKTL
jgi:hypothetical protein